MEGFLKKIEFSGTWPDNLRHMANRIDRRRLDDITLCKPVGKSAADDAAPGIPARAPASSH